jgi:hypothetical protein
MSQFETGVKKIIEGIFFKCHDISLIQTARAYCKARRKLVVGCCGEKITLHLQYKAARTPMNTAQFNITKNT